MDDRVVLIVEDDADLQDALALTLGNAGFATRVASDGEAALALLARHEVHAVVSDVQMQPMDGTALLAAVRERHPGLPVVLMTAYGSVRRAVAAMRCGADSYLVKPFEAVELVDCVNDALARHHTVTPGEVDTGAVVCGDALTVRLLGIARKVAASDATVLLSGESGTGKEVFARFVHEHSARHAAPYVAINCAAIPEHMLEAVLFGYEKGAFTGAANAQAGKFERANGGTILLDEISEMDLSLQAKLLRVLQEREVERLGGKNSIALDVRVLATTNRDLRAAVTEGRFREDLFYRLNVFPLHIPPLRERRGDVLPLFRHFLDAACRGGRSLPGLSARAEQRLLQHDWPGNVRELENLAQRTLILASGDYLDEADLAFEIAPQAPVAATATAATSSDLQRDLQSEEQRLILQALEAGDGNRQRAADQLGISPRTLRYKIARLRDAGIPIPSRGGAAGMAQSSVA